MTSDERRRLAQDARSDVQVSIVALTQALEAITRAVGPNHDASRTVAYALMQARVSDAKIELVMKRIPVEHKDPT